MEWVWTLAALVLMTVAILTGTPTLILRSTPSETVLAVETDVLRAECALGPQGIRPVLSFTVSLPPREAPTTTISFTTDSPTCVLVKPGDVIAVGDLIGYASAAALARINDLQQRLPLLEDEAILAEVEDELTRLRRANEIRALVAGRVTRVEMRQEKNELHVQLVVVLRVP